MHSRKIAIILALSFAEGAAAQADNGVAACVAKLSADGQLIFNTVLPELVPKADLRTLVRAKAIELVGNGRVSQAAAPDAALAAAACLELLRK
jgi:hypothetical protein